MKKGVLPLFSALLLSSVCSLPARASLIGSSVTGSLTFTGDPSNYFDPNNGFVPPAGYLNANGTTVAVSGSAVEFGYDDGSSLISADFAANQIMIRDVISQSGWNNGFQMMFTDSSLAGLPLILTGGNLIPAAFSIDGDVLTVNYAAAYVSSGQVLTTTVGIASAPEPSTLVLTLTSVMASFALLAFRSLRSSC